MHVLSGHVLHVVVLHPHQLLRRVISHWRGDEAVAGGHHGSGWSRRSGHHRCCCCGMHQRRIRSQRVLQTGWHHRTTVTSATPLHIPHIISVAQPTYLHLLLQQYQPTRSFRSGSQNLLAFAYIVIWVWQTSFRLLRNICSSIHPSNLSTVLSHSNLI